MHAILVNSVNDSDGNPRRGWKIIDDEGVMIEFVKDTYHGTISNASNDKYSASMIVNYDKA